MSRRRTRPWPTCASRTPPSLSLCGDSCANAEKLSAPPAGPLAELRLSSPRGDRPSRGTGGCTRTAVATGRLRPLQERRGDARVSPDLESIAHRPAVSQSGPPHAQDLSFLSFVTEDQRFGCVAARASLCHSSSWTSPDSLALPLRRERVLLRPARPSPALSGRVVAVPRRPLSSRVAGWGPHPHRSAELTLRTVDGRRSPPSAQGLRRAGERPRHPAPRRSRR